MARTDAKRCNKISQSAKNQDSFPVSQKRMIERECGGTAKGGLKPEAWSLLVTVTTHHAWEMKDEEAYPPVNEMRGRKEGR